MSVHAGVVSYLFVPATRPDRILKAVAGRAGQVIVDLEDAVSADAKAEARAGLSTVTPSRSLCVRINAATTPFFDDDIAAVSRLEWLSTVVLPKVESGTDVEHLRQRLPQVEIVALVESARGIQAVDQIAASGPIRLMFGPVDYTTSLGAEPSADVLAYPRARLVVASAAAGIVTPIDGPSVFVDRPDELAAEARAAKAFGFGAKACIHPAQLDVVHEVFTASLAEREWARRVLDASATSPGAFQLDGQMVDEPVLQRARKILRS